MSYTKSLKKSPFKTLSLILGKMPDGSIWQTAFITQDGDAPSASFTCHSDATAAERKGFLPLVKEALKRAQSLDELTDMLKPSLTRGQLLCILKKHDDPAAAVEAVLNSGLLPNTLLQQWLNNLVERAIRRVLGHSGCPVWEDWASKWLSSEDRSARAARAARAAAEAAEAARAARAAGAAEWAAARAARVIRAAGATEAAEWAARAAGAAGAERKVQYDDLLNLINDL